MNVENAKQHPTGLAGVIAPALVVILKKFGVEFTVEEALYIVGAIVAVVSFLSPRVKVAVADIQEEAPVSVEDEEDLIDITKGE